MRWIVVERKGRGTGGVFVCIPGLKVIAVFRRVDFLDTSIVPVE
jgi:hypothetical protein